MKKNNLEIQQTRQLELINENEKSKKSLKTFLLSLLFIAILFLVAFALVYGISIAKNGGPI